MHFFYLDETGDTGADLQNSEQPIFVLGGITVRDKGWRQTADAFQRVVGSFFKDEIPDDQLSGQLSKNVRNSFELNAYPFVRRAVAANAYLNRISRRTTASLCNSSCAA